MDLAVKHSHKNNAEQTTNKKQEICTTKRAEIECMVYLLNYGKIMRISLQKESESQT